MNFFHRLKDFFSDLWRKIIILLIFIGVVTLNSYLSETKGNSAITILTTISFEELPRIILLPIISAICLLSFIHDILKLMKVETKKDIRYSLIISIIFFFYLLLFNLLSILTTEQFELIISIFGIPGVLLLPKLFGYIIHRSNTLHQTTDSREGKTDIEE